MLKFPNSMDIFQVNFLLQNTEPAFFPWISTSWEPKPEQIEHKENLADELSLVHNNFEISETPS